VSVVEKARTVLAKQGQADAAKERAAATEAALAAEKAAADAAEKAARAAERERQAEQRKAETAAAAAIQRVTEDAQEAEVRAARLAAEAVVLPEVRMMARAWLRGSLSPITVGENAAPAEVRLTRRDPAAHELLSAWEHARRSLGWVAVELDFAHDLARAVDAVECRCWSAFVRRIGQLAGEVD
jgi:hypothetical protein